ncbi:MAG: hypothetical protein GY716_01480 [bacterium]|nr:hypothetical protein [bacterium]
MSPDDLEWLERRAQEAGLSRSRVLERLIHDEQRGPAAGREPSRVHPRLPLPQQQLAEFCQCHHVRKLSLFGSALTAEFDDTSDVDILVEFESDHAAGLFEIAEMAGELSAIFAGRTVDLRTPDELSRHFRDELLRQAEILYAA